jgi:hypothetical protein
VVRQRSAKPLMAVRFCSVPPYLYSVDIDIPSPGWCNWQPQQT